MHAHVDHRVEHHVLSPVDAREAMVLIVLPEMHLSGMTFGSEYAARELSDTMQFFIFSGLLKTSTSVAVAHYGKHTMVHGDCGGGQRCQTGPNWELKKPSL